MVPFKFFRSGARPMNTSKVITKLAYTPSEAYHAFSQVETLVLTGKISAASGRAYRANINRRVTIIEPPVAVIGNLTGNSSTFSSMLH